MYSSMALIQDENALEGKSSTKRAPASIYKVDKELTYNEIYLPYPKYVEKKNSRGSKELIKIETFVNNKNSMEEVTRFASNPDKSYVSEEIPKSKDEYSLGVDQEGELISALDELKKSRKENKVLKERHEAIEKLINKNRVMHEDLEYQLKIKEE